ncbi:hypothetical protein [Dyella japonica]|uniref:Uncharacterized protein n=1 Tax=Dyella japonica A8 TaxID=1217721 RepID=A0A075JVN6_9GAMM|nr:hypothetical protein [Dyella japonica]AIF45989.1 hypothetical protein HY57_01260 [Dyella japonica A8]
MRHIRVIAMPPGEAPERIRAAWIGVVLPLAETKGSQPGIWITQGVLGKDRGLLARIKRLLGMLVVEQPSVAYAVDVLAAMESLRAHSPSAAMWWERHTPHLLVPGKRFCFSAACCEEVGTQA